MDNTKEPIPIEMDQIWLKYSTQIRNCRELLSSPLTREGEDISKEAYNNTVFLAYNRLRPIFSGLISLIEAEEILGSDFFKDKTRQRVVLRAFGLLIEDQIKFPYSSEELKKYDDYRPFFESFLKRLKSFDNQVASNQDFPNFINSLIMIASQEINGLRDVENFMIQTDKIRKRIREYLPQLEKIDDGRIFEEIKNRWQKSFS